jgi:hypothetical protein
MFGVAPTPRPPSEITLAQAAELPDWTGDMVRDVAVLVGGIEKLEALHVDPLPDEEIDWSRVADTDRDVVARVLETIATADCWFLDAQYSTIIVRLLQRIVANDPQALHKGDPARTGAALVWLATRGNGQLGRRGRVTAELLWYAFRVSNCAERGRSLHRVLGFAPREKDIWGHATDVWLADPLLLHSEVRAQLLQRRQYAVTYVIAEAERRLAATPIVDLGNGKVSIKGRLVMPRWAIRAPTQNGRSTVLVTFGETNDDAEVLGLSVPDARRLVTMLQEALDSPVRRNSA